MAPRKRKTAAATTTNANNKTTAPDYDAMKVAELRVACDNAGLDSKGSKAVLVKRLKENQGDAQPPAKLTKVESDNTKIRRILTEDINKSAKKTAKAKVDKSVPLAGVSVYEDYDCMLNQTNINANNNKYYIIQMLTDNNGTYWTWNRWGRVGESGANKLDNCGTDKDSAIKAFKKKFQDKTKNKWENRENFEAVAGKYTLLEMTGDDDDDDEENGSVDVPDAGSPKKTDGKTLPCTLDAATQKFIKLIFDQDMFKDAMKSMDIDVKKMPLGKLSKIQIAKGFEALVAIEEALKNKKNSTELGLLTSRFYTLIPHDFGRTRPPVIDNMDLVQKKKDMLLVLSDIEMAQSMQKETDIKKETGDLPEHPLDASFKDLACSMDLMDSKEKEHKIICDYIKATGPGHLKLLDMWKINRETSDKRFAAHDDIKNRKLLWHGTNVAVVAAILKTGLRIMPHSGGRVGKGIYFASENSKSAGYVCPTGRWSNCANDEDGIGVMFLAEVALGKEKHISRDNSSLKEAPKGYDSIVARGHQEPDPKKDTSISIDGKKVTVPQGKPVDQSEFLNSSFWQSEYLVYKESQVHLRYMLKLKFYENNGW